MTKLMRISLGTLCALLAVVVTARATARVAEPVDPCVAGALRTVALAEPIAVDEIIVETAAHSPEDGAADVRVGAARSERVVHVLGAAPRALTFDPPMTGAVFDVAVEPAMDTAASACVDRVVLLHDGRVMTAVDL